MYIWCGGYALVCKEIILSSLTSTYKSTLLLCLLCVCTQLVGLDAILALSQAGQTSQDLVHHWNFSLISELFSSKNSWRSALTTTTTRWNRKRTFNFYPPKIVSQIDYTVCGNHLGLEIVFYGWCATQRATKWEKSVYTPNKKCAMKVFLNCFFTIHRPNSRSALFEKSSFQNQRLLHFFGFLITLHWWQWLLLQWHQAIPSTFPVKDYPQSCQLVFVTKKIGKKSLFSS